MIAARIALFVVAIGLATTAFAHAFDPFAEEKQAALSQLLETAAGGDLQDALLQTDSAIAQFPEHAPFFALKSQLLLKAGRIGQARAASEQAVTLAPDSALARWTRGLVRQHQGDAAAAFADFDHAVKQEEDNESLRIQVLGSRGMALVDLGRHREALADLDRVIEIRSNAFAERQFRASALLKLNRLDSAERDIATLLEMDSSDARSHRLHAELLERRGRTHEAEAALATAERLAAESTGNAARTSTVP